MQEVHAETLARSTFGQIHASEETKSNQPSDTRPLSRQRGKEIGEQIQFNTCFKVAIDNIFSNVPMILELIYKS
jgi:hypothetical protein